MSAPQPPRCPRRPQSVSRHRPPAHRTVRGEAWHSYTLRFVDPPDAPLPFAADVIVSRGPFLLNGELEMMRERGIGWIVARNSGGDGARAKIDAARVLGLPVIMISRPELPERRRVESVIEVMQWLGH